MIGPLLCVFLKMELKFAENIVGILAILRKHTV
jgi:hypothetical protein